MTMHDRDSARKGWIALLLLSGAVGAAAYAGRPGARNGGSQVWGRVTARGAPVTDGTIVLRPVVEKDATWGAGALGSEGRFHLEGSRRDVPLLPGRYFVYLRPPTRADYVTGQMVAPPDYPVAEKYMDSSAPLILVDIRDEPTLLDLNLDD